MGRNFSNSLTDGTDKTDETPSDPGSVSFVSAPNEQIQKIEAEAMTFITHAGNVYRKAAAAFVGAAEMEDANKLSAARDKVPMPEHYWQRTHAARLRLQAARAVYEAAQEAAI